MADKNDFSELLAEMLIRMDQQQGEIKQTNEILRTVADVQTRMLTQMELIYTNQQHFNERQLGFNDRQIGFNERQEQFNERQEQFNERQLSFNDRQEQFNERQLSFNERQEQFNERQEKINTEVLSELREIKTAQQELTAAFARFADYEQRLTRLEEFMRRAS